jgi:hypothetical protein
LPATVSVISKVNRPPTAVNLNIRSPWKRTCVPITLGGYDPETSGSGLVFQFVDDPKHGFWALTNSLVNHTVYGSKLMQEFGGVSYPESFGLTYQDGLDISEDPKAPWVGARTICYVTFSPTFTGYDSFTYRVWDTGFPSGCTVAGPSCIAPKASEEKTVSIEIFELD